MGDSPQKRNGRPLVPWLVVLLGLASVAVAVTLATSATPGRALVSFPMYAGLVLGGLILTGVGLLSGRRARANAAHDYGHAYPVFGLVALVIITVMAGRQLFVPPTYGQYGHYRGAAPLESRRFQPKHLGQARCTECHADIVKLHDKDAHAQVACEACHGPGHAHKLHQENAGKPCKQCHRKKVEAKNIPKPLRDRSQAACLVCHQRLLARPAAFPQIQVAEHYGLVGVKNPKLACIKCHSPHEPFFMDRDLRKARLHPLVQRCRDCHAGRSDDRMARPANHPAIFECAYCHKKRVADFARRKHKKLRCTTCHIFVKQTQFAGRIIRDSDPRFCLLCHRKASFRSAKAAPGIDPKKHEGDAKTPCIECHSDAIHGEVPKSTAGKPATPAAAPPREAPMTPPARPADGMEPAAPTKEPAAAPARRPAAAPARRPAAPPPAPRPAKGKPP